MNIFFVDKDPVVAARCLVDQHVNKMVTETAQILSNCYSLDELASAPLTATGNIRKYSYPHHPCCKWVKESLSNFYWLCQHGHGLEQERLYRGFNPSISYQFIKWCMMSPPSKVVDIWGLTPVVQAFGQQWSHLRCDDPVKAYRKYYCIAKAQQITLKKKWTNRKPPEWWPNGI